jgi:signal transduction histidine kinase
MFFQPSRMRQIVVLGAIAYAIVLASAVVSLWDMATVDKSSGWVASNRAPQVVTSVDPAGPAAGELKIGDRVVGVNGDTDFAGFYVPSAQVRAYAPGAAYRLKVVREGREFEITLHLRARTDRSLLPFIYAYLFGSVAFFSAGMLMGWKRPDSLTAQLGWWAGLLTAFFYISLSFSNLRGWWPPPAAWAARLAFPWHFFAIYCFVAAFPFPGLETRLWRGFRITLIPLCAFQSIWHFAVWGFPWTKAVWMADPIWFANLRTPIYFGTQWLFNLGIIAVIVRNYLRSRGPADRRRIEIVAGVIAASLIVSLCTNVYSAIAFLTIPQGRTGAYVSMLGNLAPLAVPFSFYYAVVAHQVLDIRLVIRRGLQHLLAKQVLRVVMLLPLAVIVVFAIRHPNVTIGSALNLTGIGLMAGTALCLEFRGVILAAVDRWFFRETFDREKLVRELLGEIAHAGSFDGIVNLVRARLDAIFAPEFVEVAAGDGAFSNPAALRIPFSGPSGKVAGWLSMGARKSEESYTSADMELLELVASQIGMMGENLLMALAGTAAALGERTRIAQELHDTLSQGFVAISIYLEAAHKSIAGSPEQAGVFLEAARKLARESEQETRHSLQDLRTSSSATSAVGSHLEFRLRALANRTALASDSGLPEGPQVSLDLPPGICDLASADAGWHLARVAEEAVTNIYKHAHATRINIALSIEGGKDGGKDGGQDGRQLVLSVQDDGTGFETGRPVSGFGVRGMRERMGSVHGTMEIHSTSGKGTEVHAAVPLSEREVGTFAGASA